MVGEGREGEASHIKYHALRRRKWGECCCCYRQQITAVPCQLIKTLNLCQNHHHLRSNHFDLCHWPRVNIKFSKSMGKFCKCFVILILFLLCLILESPSRSFRIFLDNSYGSSGLGTLFD